MKSLTLLILLLGVCFGHSSAHAQTVKTTRILDSLPYLQEELFYMEDIEQYLFKVEKTKMKMFEVYTTQVITKLQDPERGLGHQETSEAFIDLISAIDGDDSFFNTIRMGNTTGSIDKILIIQGKLVASYGFHRNAYAQNLHRLLTQIELQLRSLSTNSISDELRTKISEIYRPIGIASSKASVGDTRKAYEASRDVANRLSAMYEDLHKLSGSDQIFESGLMIEFLNERLISYGQYDLN